jgi:hypothetical protein
MKNNSTSRIFVPATHAMVLCFLLASGISALAQSGNGESGNGRCSNRTLNGSYGFLLDGTILGPNLPFRGVVMQRYDGNGNITQVDHVVIAGGPPPQEWTPGTGSYTVNPDCTGSAVLSIPGNPLSPVNLHFVVVNNGKQINQVVDANAVTAVGIKVN